MDFDPRVETSRVDDGLIAVRIVVGEHKTQKEADEHAARLTELLFRCACLLELEGQ